jgi:hypothetical protein
MTKDCNKPRYYLAALLALGLVPALWASSQTTYKWLDESGNVTYGDHPPLGVKAEEIRISTGTSSSTTEAVSGTTPETTPTASEPANTQPATQSGLTPEKAKALCEQAKNNLVVLKSHALIRQTDENGEVLILDEGQKQEQIDTANAIIKDYCQ